MPESAASPTAEASTDPAATALRRAFGQRLCALRGDAGMTKTEVASAAHVDRTFYGQVENGQRNISLDKISAIAGALNVTVEALFVDLHTDQEDGSERA